MNTNTNTNTTATETVTMADLNPGDVVLNYGLRIQLGEKNQGYSRPDVIWFPGTILNPEHLATEDGRMMFRGLIPLDGSNLSWTVQGIPSVRWTRETPTN